MNDPRRPQRFGPPLSGYGPTGPQVPPNPPTADPAYADQSPYASTYGGYVSPPWSPGGPPPRPPQWPPGPHEASPTQQLPQYWQYDQPPPGGFPPDGLTPPPPQGPRTPRWLWFAAGSAVLLVVALVIALVIANGSVKKQTAIEPLPPMPGPSPTRPTTTTPTPPSPSAAPAPTTTTGTPSETVAGAMQTVVYDVTGEGRAISITYMDSGSVIQTEFNVALPWRKEVSLSKSSLHPASVTIVNIGHNVTCSVTVAGVQVRQRTGAGLTICDAPS
ncbi:MmpS family transport accessory protein [Mycobacterium tuberculosis]|uniref:MmpS family transport accessory protein n=1 Tax=Mycobacterium tuberculosis TaxID=1773 RepID=UPI00045B7F83|nr:MmpS family transport accessory protein [Mycobacterium tuberculosis]KBI59084.1 proline rich membrane protein [Mycobacterium tuberculosis variant africanum MAL020185]